MNFAEQLNAQIKQEQVEANIKKTQQEAEHRAYIERKKIEALTKIPEYVNEIKQECLAVRNNRRYFTYYKEYDPMYLVAEELKQALENEGLVVKYTHEYNPESNDIEMPTRAYWSKDFIIEW